jgi:hypothetical protein
MEYTRTIKQHTVTAPGNGDAAARRVELSQISSGKILVHNAETSSHAVWVLGGGDTVDADTAPTPTDNRSYVGAGFARVIDVGSSTHVSVKVKGSSSDHDVIIEEVT